MHPLERPPRVVLTRKPNPVAFHRCAELRPIRAVPDSLRRVELRTPPRRRIDDLNPQMRAFSRNPDVQRLGLGKRDIGQTMPAFARTDNTNSPEPVSRIRHFPASG